jgi:hypothetical protein
MLIASNPARAFGDLSAKPWSIKPGRAVRRCAVLIYGNHGHATAPHSILKIPVDDIEDELLNAGIELEQDIGRHGSRIRPKISCR